MKKTTKTLLTLCAFLAVAAVLMAVLALRSPTASAGGEPASAPSSPAQENAQPQPVTAQEPALIDPPATLPDKLPEKESGPEPEPAPPPPFTAVDAMYALGFLPAAGVNGDGTPNLAPDNALSREEALTMVVRARGHEQDAKHIGIASPFADVDAWAAPYVGYAYETGLVKGRDDGTLGAGEAVSLREFMAYVLRATGNPNFGWQWAAHVARNLGYIEPFEGDASGPITRLEAAEAIRTMLTKEEEGKTPLARLLENGTVTMEKIEAARMTEALAGYDPSAVSLAAVSSGLEDKHLSYKGFNPLGEQVGSGFGWFVGENLALGELEDISGALALKVYAPDGTAYDVSEIVFASRDTGLFCARLSAAAPAFFEAGEGEARYLAGDLVTTTAPVEKPAVSCGEVLLDNHGRLVGVGTVKGTVARLPADTGSGMTLRELAQKEWPEALLVRYIDPSKPMVCITYDDGPSASVTPKILDVLEEYGAVATFFEVGTNLKAHPEFLSRMEELGCEVGNHSWNHPQLTKLSASEIKSQIEDTNAVIRKELGHGARLVRPPYGAVNSTVKSAVQYPMINWNVDTEDWRYRDADHVVGAVTSISNLDGKIILMHSLYQSTLEATKRIVPWLIDQGYQLVTVSEMAAARGYDLQNGTVYSGFKAK